MGLISFVFLLLLYFLPPESCRPAMEVVLLRKRFKSTYSRSIYLIHSRHFNRLGGQDKASCLLPDRLLKMKKKIDWKQRHLFKSRDLFLILFTPLALTSVRFYNRNPHNHIQWLDAVSFFLFFDWTIRLEEANNRNTSLIALTLDVYVYRKEASLFVAPISG